MQKTVYTYATMANWASKRAQLTALGRSSTVLIALLMLLTCCTSDARSASVCPQDPRPHNESIWNDSPSDVNVTVIWTVGEVCSTTSECFRVGNSDNDDSEPQLYPIYIQRGVSLWFQPETYSTVTVPLQYYVTDGVGFKTCNTTRGRLLPAADQGSASLLVTSEYFGNNTIYFVAQSPIFECNAGLRINITVQDWDCGAGKQTTSQACSSRGVCAVRPWATHYECYCCEGFSGEYCDIEPCSPEPCLNAGTCIVTRSNRPPHFTCHCLPEFTGRLCETKVTVCDVNICENGGACRRTLNGSIYCACPVGYGGPNCSLLAPNKVTTDVDVTMTTPYPVTSAVASATESVVQPQQPARMLNEAESGLMLTLGIVAAVLFVILLLLLILLIVVRCRAVTSKQSQRGSYYPRDQWYQEYDDGGYYNTAEFFSAAHPVPYGPELGPEVPEWYWESTTTTGSSKSSVSRSPMLIT